MEIGVLGSLEVRRADVQIEVRRGHPRTLLCALVLHRGDAVPFETLADRLWGHDPPAHPTNALQTQIAYLRRTLGEDGPALIVTRPTGYALRHNHVTVDAAHFEHLLTEARRLLAGRTQAGLEDALARYEEALALWRGPAFAEVSDAEWARGEIVRLDELRLGATESRLDVLLDLGRDADAVAELNGLVADHPLRERLWELLMVALYRTGRQADALRAYERARQVLAEQLGITPGPALRRLERQVLDQDPALDRSAPAVTVASAQAPWSTTDAGHVTVSPPVRPPDELIGRDQDLARTSQLLADRGLLTLVGPGGSGKTRLAIELANLQDARVVHFVDLAPIEEPAEVARAIAASLQLPVSDAAGVTPTIVGALAGSGALVVLDTCERVVAGVAPLVEALRSGAPDVAVLATSRTPLGVRDELTWSVAPLALPHHATAAGSPAVELFLRRAAAVNADLRVDPSTIATIVEVCRMLDGLPLAIELAATQLDVLAPEAVLVALRHGRARLVAPEPVPPRQRTLHTTIEWSIDLLDDAQRDLLTRLSVLAGTFDVEAAVAVADPADPDPLATFLSLARSSLVAPAGDGRHRLLDTIRAHVVATSDRSPSILDAGRRHAAHYAGVAERAIVDVRSERQSAWFPRLRADRANLHAALDWCFSAAGDDQLGARFAADIAWIWTLTGDLVDAREALQRAAGVDVPDEIRRRVLLGLGLLAAPLGELEVARDVCAASAEISRRLGDRRSVADALLTLGVAQWGLGELAAASASHDEAIQSYDALADLTGSTICRILRARTARDQGELDLATELLADAVDDARSTGDAHVVGLAFEQHARLALAQGDVEVALDAATACRRANEEIDYIEGICAALGLLARVRLARCEPDEARRLVLQALERATRIRHPGAQCEALELLAEAEAARGGTATALALLLHVERVRSRRRLPRPRSDSVRLATIRERLVAELGDDCDVVERRVALTSFEDVVRSVLGG